MSTYDWFDAVPYDDPDDGLTDAEIEAKYGIGQPDEPAGKAATDNKPDGDSGPITTSAVPARPDFSAVEKATSLDEAIAATNAAIEAARPRAADSTPARSPEEQRAAIDEALKDVTNAEQALAALAEIGLVAR
jgi:peptidoglycan hydrolase-like protein with peptidoglycan-binding domain